MSIFILCGCPFKNYLDFDKVVFVFYSLLIMVMYLIVPGQCLQRAKSTRFDVE